MRRVSCVLRAAKGSSSALRVARRSWHDAVTLGSNPHGAPLLHAKAAAAAAAAAATPPPLLLRALASAHARAPAATALVAAAATSSAGDALAQLLEIVSGGYASKLDARRRAQRNGALAAYAALAVGGIGHLWRRALWRNFPGYTYEAGLRASLDLCFFAPPLLAGVSVVVQLFRTGTFELVGRNVNLGMHLLPWLWVVWGGGVWSSYMLATLAWQPAHALALGVAWSAFLSHRLHGGGVSDELRFIGEYLRGESSPASTSE